MPASKKVADPAPDLGQVEADNYQRLNTETGQPKAPAIPDSEE